MTEIIKVLRGRRIRGYPAGVEDVRGEPGLSDLDRGEDWIDSGPNAIALDTGGCDHVLIAYELWDGEPTTPDWDESRSGSVRLTSGKTCAISGSSGELDHHEEFDLGRREHEWRFKAHRRLLRHDGFTADAIGFALFKLQFWSPVKEAAS
ncbi:hypothetical protein ACFOWE_22020 [Planomonospora corallina]|uniref:Uncharacterized protein n=1 Tax=Planomonospora corallina TaxID=1806052 RepID=A0ABV8IEP2_9ACTN